MGIPTSWCPRLIWCFTTIEKDDVHILNKLFKSPIVFATRLHQRQNSMSSIQDDLMRHINWANIYCSQLYESNILGKYVSVREFVYWYEFVLICRKHVYNPVFVNKFLFKTDSREIYVTLINMLIYLIYQISQFTAVCYESIFVNWHYFWLKAISSNYDKCQ